MKFVPSLSPPATAPEIAPEVQALSGVKRARPVQARISPPLIVQPHVRHEVPPEIEVEAERRHDPHANGERRTYCRRVEHRPMLIELRSGRERRRHNQRASDITEHIDEKV
jgi:hypothetical protein